MTNPTDYTTERPTVGDMFIGMQSFDLSFIPDGETPERKFSKTKGLNLREAIEKAPAVIMGLMLWSRLDKETGLVKVFNCEKQDAVLTYLRNCPGAKEMFYWSLLPFAKKHAVEVGKYPHATVEQIVLNDPDYVTTHIMNWGDCLTQRYALALQVDPEMDEAMSKMTCEIQFGEPEQEERPSDKYAEELVAK